jgi:hypothetical protein
MMKFFHMKTLLVVLLFIVLSASLGLAEEDKPLTDERKFGFAWNIFGPTGFTSLSANFFITSKIKVETGAGLFGYFGGSTYHFIDSENNSDRPYAGAYIARIGSLGGIYPILYLPVGIDVGGNRKKGCTFSIELAYVRDTKDNKNGIYGALKVGYYPKNRP